MSAQTATAPTTVPSWAQSSIAMNGGVTSHTATINENDGYAIRIAQADDGDGPGQPVVVVSADLLEGEEIRNFIADLVVASKLIEH